MPQTYMQEDTMPKPLRKVVGYVNVPVFPERQGVPMTPRSKGEKKEAERIYDAKPIGRDGFVAAIKTALLARSAKAWEEGFAHGASWVTATDHTNPYTPTPAPEGGR